jgi:protein-disulfide isomerase
LKLNTADFNSCFDSKKYADEVNKDNQEGTSFGVTGTPTFYIGNEKEGYTQLVGAQPFATFKTTIDQAFSGNSTQ